MAINMDLKVQVKDEESFPNLQNLIKRRGEKIFRTCLNDNN